MPEYERLGELLSRQKRETENQLGYQEDEAISVLVSTGRSTDIISVSNESYSTHVGTHHRPYPSWLHATAASVTFGGSGNGAKAVAYVDNGSISRVFVYDGGSGYTNGVTAQIEGGGGSGAVLGNITARGGSVVSVEVMNGGSGYDAPYDNSPILWYPLTETSRFTDAVGFDSVNSRRYDMAQDAESEFSRYGEGVESIHLLDGGDGYTTPPPVTITSPVHSSFDPSSAVNRGTLATGLTSPHGLASHNGSLWLVNRSGNDLWELATPADPSSAVDRGELPLTLNHPGSIASHNGSLWIVDGTTLWELVNTSDPGTAVNRGTLPMGATATAVVSGGAVTAITLTRGGSGYTSSPTVTLTGGGGSGATATATISNGVVTGFTITDGGSGYTSAPTVTIVGTAIPSGITSFNGNLWLVSGNTLWKLADTSNPSTAVNRGTFPVGLTTPRGLTSLRGSLYVVDTTTLWELADTSDPGTAVNRGTFPGIGMSIEGIVLHEDSLWVVNDAENDLWQLDSLPDIDTVIHRGVFPTGAFAPRGIASHNGSLWLVSGNTLWRLDDPSNPSSTVYVGRFPTGVDTPRGITSHDGSLWLVDGTTLWELADTSDPSTAVNRGNLPSLLTSPEGLASLNSDLYIVTGRDLWILFNASNPITNPSDAVRRSGDSGFLTTPRGLANLNDRLWIVYEDDNTLYEMTNLHSPIRRTDHGSLPAGLTSPQGLTAHNNSLWIISDSTLWELATPNSPGMAVTRGAFPTGIGTPQSVALHNGSLWTVVGSVLWELATPNSPGMAVTRGAFPTGIGTPQGITSHDGSLWIAGNSALWELADPSMPGSAVSRGAFPADLTLPRDIVSARGNLWVVDSVGRGRLWELADTSNPSAAVDRGFIWGSTAWTPGSAVYLRDSIWLVNEHDNTLWEIPIPSLPHTGVNRTTLIPGLPTMQGLAARGGNLWLLSGSSLWEVVLPSSAATLSNRGDFNVTLSSPQDVTRHNNLTYLVQTNGDLWVSPSFTASAFRYVGRLPVSQARGIASHNGRLLILASSVSFGVITVSLWELNVPSSSALDVSAHTATRVSAGNVTAGGNYLRGAFPTGMTSHRGSLWVTYSYRGVYSFSFRGYLVEITDVDTPSATYRGYLPADLQSPSGITPDGDSLLIVDDDDGDLWELGRNTNPRNAVNRGSFPSNTAFTAVFSTTYLGFTNLYLFSGNSIWFLRSFTAPAGFSSNTPSQAYYSSSFTTTQFSGSTGIAEHNGTFWSASGGGDIGELTDPFDTRTFVKRGALPATTDSVRAIAFHNNSLWIVRNRTLWELATPSSPISAVYRGAFPSGAAARPVISAGGVITEVTMVAGGSGYTAPPAVRFSSGAFGATATAVLTPTSVASVFVTAGGSGYTSSPTVTLTGGGGSGATATAIIDDDTNVVTAITITAGGSGYTSAPTVTLTGGGGSGATATAVLTPTSVASVSVTNGGTGGNLGTRLNFADLSNVTDITSHGGSLWLTASVSLSEGTLWRLDNPANPSSAVSVGAISGGATATATISGGAVTNISLGPGGFGYDSDVSNVVITGGGGSGAFASIVTSGGVVTDITISNGGTGYTSAPTVSIVGRNTFHSIASSNGSLWMTGGSVLWELPNTSDIGTLVARDAVSGTVSASYLTAYNSNLWGLFFNLFRPQLWTLSLPLASTSVSNRGVLPLDIDVVDVASHDGHLWVLDNLNTPRLWQLTVPSNPSLAVSIGTLPSGLTAPRSLASHRGTGSLDLSLWILSGSTLWELADTSDPSTAVNRGTLPVGLGTPNGLSSHAGSLWIAGDTSLWELADPSVPSTAVNRTTLPAGASVTSAISSSVIVGFRIFNGGTGYTSAPTVSITGGGGSGATATATVSGGAVTALTISDGGTGYTSAPTVSITGGGGSGASVGAMLSGGAVTALTITNGGTGYTSAPTVTITGGGGTGATATATISGGAVTGYALTNPGSGYTSAPTVTLDPSSDIRGLDSYGSSLWLVRGSVLWEMNSATATSSISSGSVGEIVLTSGGMNYIAAPTVTLTGGGGSGATATAIISNGVVTSITIDNGGTGYTSAPTVMFSLPALISRGTLPANLSIPQGIASFADSLWFVDTFDNDLWEFSVPPNPSTAESMGVLPAGLTLPSGITSHAGSLWIASDNALWELATPSNPSSAVNRGDFPMGVGNPGALASHAGSLWIASDNALWELATPSNPSSAVNRGDLPVDAQIAGLTSHGGSLWILDVAGFPRLWELATPSNPSSASYIGLLASDLSTSRGMTSHGNALWFVSNYGDDIWELTDPFDPSSAIRKGRFPDALTGSLGITSHTQSLWVVDNHGDELWEFQAPTQGANATAVAYVGSVESVDLTDFGDGYEPHVGAVFAGGGGGAASAVVTVEFGVVTSITISDGGSGYTYAPTVTLTGGGGSGASATATISNGVVTAITIDNGGSGYTASPTVALMEGGGSGASATAVVSDGVVTKIDVLDGGDNYTSAPTVTLTGGGGSGATAIASVNASTGKVTAVSVTNGGSGYNASLSVEIEAGRLDSGGNAVELSRARATAVIGRLRLGAYTSTSSDYISSWVGGDSYATAPQVVVVGGGGEGAQISATIDTNGALTQLEVTDGGHGYVTTPTLRFIGVPDEDAVVVFKEAILERVVSRIDVVYGGYGYDRSNASSYVVSITGGGATSNAVARLRSADITQSVAFIEVTNSGYGYDIANSPAVSIRGTARAYAGLNDTANVYYEPLDVFNSNVRLTRARPHWKVRESVVSSEFIALLSSNSELSFGVRIRPNSAPPVGTYQNVFHIGSSLYLALYTIREGDTRLMLVVSDSVLLGPRVVCDGSWRSIVATFDASLWVMDSANDILWEVADTSNPDSNIENRGAYYMPHVSPPTLARTRGMTSHGRSLWMVDNGVDSLWELSDVSNASFVVNRGDFPSELRAPLGITAHLGSLWMADNHEDELWELSDTSNPSSAVNRGVFPTGLSAPQGSASHRGSLWIVSGTSLWELSDTSNPSSAVNRGDLPSGVPAPRALTSHAGSLWVAGSNALWELRDVTDTNSAVNRTFSIGSDRVVSVLLTSGSGYTSAPTVTISGGGGTGASAIAEVAYGGDYLDFIFLTSGSGYTSAPTVSITGGGGSGATATATISNGAVTGYALTNPGSGYTSAPTVTITGGGGTGATATATISNGAVTGISLTSGSGYTSAPTVSITGGGGTGATATATVSGGAVTGISLTSGSGYTSAPTVSITGGGGTGATATATISGGVVTSITVSDGGMGYTASPTVAFTGGGGSGVTAIVRRLGIAGLASRRDVARGRIYMDDDASFTPIPLYDVLLSSRPFTLGGEYDGVKMFDGDVSDVVIWPGSVLTEGQARAFIQDDYADAMITNRSRPSVFGYYSEGASAPTSTNPSNPVNRQVYRDTESGLFYMYYEREGSGATATVIRTGDRVTGFAVTNGGAGYTSAPTVNITPLSDGAGTGAAAIAVIENGVVTGITVSLSGSGYILPPTVELVNSGWVQVDASELDTNSMVISTTESNIVLGNRFL